MTYPRISAAINRKKDRIQRFTYAPSMKNGVPLAVTLKHRPARAIQEEVDQLKTRILQRSKFIEVNERSAQEQELNEFFNKILVDNVIKIESEEFFPGENGKRKPVAWKHIKPLLNMTEAKIAEFGGMDAAVAVDPTVTDKDEAEAARENILSLISDCDDFKQWVIGVVSDVGWFQGKEFDDEVKNLLAAQTPPTAQAA